MSNLFYHISGIILFALVAPALPQNESALAGRLTKSLAKQGFENVAVLQDDQALIVAYENRLYRDELAAAKEVIAMVSALANEELQVTLIPQNRKIPLLAIRMVLSHNGKPAMKESAVTVDFDVDGAWKKLQAVPRANASTGKIDLVVHPQINAEFASYNNPVTTQINLAPALQTNLWPGMALLAQLIIPLHNELGKAGDEIRPGLLVANQALRLPQNIFLSASLGYFTQNRYGLDLEAQKHFLQGKAAIGANFGYTGHAAYLAGAWSYSPLERATMSLHSEFRLTRFDLVWRATYGKYLYQDTGWRVELVRPFKEVDFGFFLMQSDEELNTGFHFSVPIFPPKHLRAGAIRVRTAEYFAWEYRYKGFPNSGVVYDTGNRLEGFIKRLNPSYVGNQVNYYRRWRDLEPVHE